MNLKKLFSITAIVALIGSTIPAFALDGQASDYQELLVSMPQFINILKKTDGANSLASTLQITSTTVGSYTVTNPTALKVMFTAETNMTSGAHAYLTAEAPYGSGTYFGALDSANGRLVLTHSTVNPASSDAITDALAASPTATSNQNTIRVTCSAAGTNLPPTAGAASADLTAPVTSTATRYDFTLAQGLNTISLDIGTGTSIVEPSTFSMLDQNGTYTAKVTLTSATP